MSGIEGGDELIRKLKGLGDKLEGALEAAVTAGAWEITNAAKQKAPYRTGNLKRSIHPETGKKSPTSVTVRVGTDVIYAHNQEFGTTVPAHPYLRPALDENKGQAVKTIRESLADVVRKATT